MKVLGLFAVLAVAMPQAAQAAAGHSNLYTNAVTEGGVAYGTNYGAAFKMMFPGDNSYRIQVSEFSWMPTNLFGSTFALYTGDTVSGVAVSVAGASGDSALTLSGTNATNGFCVPLKCLVQLPSNRLIMLTVSNIIVGGGSNYIAFNETLGVAVPVNSKIYQLNRSNVWINQTTNEIERINSFAGRFKYPMLLEVSDGGAARLKLDYVP